MRRREPPAEDATALDCRATILRMLLPDPRALDALFELDPRCYYAALIGRIDLVEASHAVGNFRHLDEWSRRDGVLYQGNLVPGRK